MAHIYSDNVEFTGREIKAMAKFCGKGGHVIFENGSIYLIISGNVGCARIHLYEEHKTTFLDPAKADEIYVNRAFEDYKLWFSNRFIAKMSKVKVADAVRIYKTGEVFINGVVADDVPEVWNEALESNLPVLDAAIDLESDEAKLSAVPVLPSLFEKVNQIVDGFKISDSVIVEVNGVDARSVVNPKCDANRTCPAIVVNMASRRCSDNNMGFELGMVYLGLVDVK